MPQSIEEQIGTLSAVKAEAHLFEVNGEMFCGNLVPRSSDSALQERECRFDGVRVSIPV